MLIKNPTFSLATWYRFIVRIFLLFGLVLVLFTDKYAAHRKFNSFGTEWLDYFMRYFTFLGDGVFALMLSLFALLKNMRLGMLLLFSYVGSALITQLLKKIAFTNHHRPYHYFKNDLSFRFIENFDYHSHHSFPSGHATSCFALFTILAIHFEVKIFYQLVFALLAISVALSRVYLSQHFLQDIIAGSMIGYIFSSVSWIFLRDKLAKFNRPFKKAN
ncbi:MAG: phosphatase PAP2 family protein [Bacteroidetes bacterium]|nr:phosphatase PAP2 family protein [Bacteroidota bacterium]